MAFETSFYVKPRDLYPIQPGEILPAQFFEVFQGNAGSDLWPEKGLMLAVLEDAILLFQKHVLAQDGRGRRLFRETEDWMLEEDSDGLFSFKSICEILGLDAGYLRCGLQRWKERKMAELAEQENRPDRRQGLRGFGSRLIDWR